MNNIISIKQLNATPIYGGLSQIVTAIVQKSKMVQAMRNKVNGLFCLVIVFN